LRIKKTFARIHLNSWRKKKQQVSCDSNNVGVCYISRVPPNMQVSKLRELLDPYGVERIYLIPKEGGGKRKNFDKRRSYNEGWVEF
jgi:ESF2/ABP1 family protein